MISINLFVMGAALPLCRRIWNGVFRTHGLQMLSQEHRSNLVFLKGAWIYFLVLAVVSIICPKLLGFIYLATPCIPFILILFAHSFTHTVDLWIYVRSTPPFGTMRAQI